MNLFGAIEINLCLVWISQLSSTNNFNVKLTIHDKNLSNLPKIIDPNESVTLCTIIKIDFYDKDKSLYHTKRLYH